MTRTISYTSRDHRKITTLHCSKVSSSSGLEASNWVFEALVFGQWIFPPHTHTLFYHFSNAQPSTTSIAVTISQKTWLLQAFPPTTRTHRCNSALLSTFLLVIHTQYTCVEICQSQDSKITEQGGHWDPAILNHLVVLRPGCLQTLWLSALPLHMKVYLE